MSERPPRPGYYGRPIVKPPVWTWEIPLYFFLGGLGGMADVLAAAGWFVHAEVDLVRTALWIAFAASVAAPILLILDLGRPRRFLNMLRVFKWRSPMSMGAWALTGWGAHSAAAVAFYEWILRARPAGAAGSVAEVLLVAALAGGAFYGALIAVYTGVLLAATAIPAWHTHARSLPVHFGIAGLGSAAAALLLAGVRLPELGLLLVGAAVVETAFGAWIEVRRHGAADRALREGASGALLRVAGALAGPAALVLGLLGAWPWAAAAFLAGALLSRYGWLAAGRASGADPEATLAAERAG